jgi:hypothetical protein
MCDPSPQYKDQGKSAQQGEQGIQQRGPFYIENLEYAVRKAKVQLAACEKNLADAQKGPAAELRDLIHAKIGIHYSANQLRNFILQHWPELCRLAHAIHNDWPELCEKS